MDKKTRLRQAVALRLKKVRHSLDYTQVQMAKFFGIARTTYTRHELGDSFPSYTILKKIGNKFDISLDWLIRGYGPMHYKVKREANATDDGKGIAEEYRELLEYMEKVPLCRYEVLAFFQRFKLENKELLEPIETLSDSISLSEKSAE